MDVAVGSDDQRNKIKIKVKDDEFAANSLATTSLDVPGTGSTWTDQNVCANYHGWRHNRCP